MTNKRRKLHSLSKACAFESILTNLSVHRGKVRFKCYLKIGSDDSIFYLFNIFVVVVTAPGTDQDRQQKSVSIQLYDIFYVLNIYIDIISCSYKKKLWYDCH